MEVLIEYFLFSGIVLMPYLRFKGLRIGSYAIEKGIVTSCLGVISKLLFLILVKDDFSSLMGMFNFFERSFSI
jgi:hypothetical protein